MVKLHHTGVALVLALLLCATLFSSGAFAQSAAHHSASTRTTAAITTEMQCTTQSVSTQHAQGSIQTNNQQGPSAWPRHCCPRNAYCLCHRVRVGWIWHWHWIRICPPRCPPKQHPGRY